MMKTQKKEKCNLILRHLFSTYTDHHWQNSTFWAIAFLRRFCQIWTGFYFIGFRNNNFYRARSSALPPTPNLEDQVPVFISPSDRVTQLYPQAPGSLFVAFCKSQGYGGGILTRLHTGKHLYIQPDKLFKLWAQREHMPIFCLWNVGLL
jgi:hypothetical protein